MFAHELHVCVYPISVYICWPSIGMRRYDGPRRYLYNVPVARLYRYAARCISRGCAALTPGCDIARLQRAGGMRHFVARRIYSQLTIHNSRFTHNFAITGLSCMYNMGCPVLGQVWRTCEDPIFQSIICFRLDAGWHECISSRCRIGGNAIGPISDRRRYANRETECSCAPDPIITVGDLLFTGIWTADWRTTLAPPHGECTKCRNIRIHGRFRMFLSSGITERPAYCL